jgi:MSHA pilin protein MshA
MKQFNKQAGFTLIELIMVIVILGVLSAFALPRFADLGGNARTASINGLAGTIKAAANIAHAQSLAAGSASGDAATLEGASVTMVEFYPTADADGIQSAAQISTSDYTPTGGGATAGAAITFALQTDCNVVYTAAAVGGTPTAVATVSGC